ncbi:DNA methyltransferase [Aeromonas caviae]|uniref:DNA methyltransferase n=1 Tax=Aeromonas caviae TaxID=648 RepID=A0ABU5WB22_AERCA|nr:DNA methyltransferase [Aeromonas caviae]MEA9438059.1 DNA methyltransferase [Aeromonas caviae]
MQQDSLFSSDSPEQDQTAGPVTCLGKTFANDQARRDYFLALLAEKLKDPEFRKIEGFPIGSDEDILNLSDPPYYTACPNPWIGDFIAEWEAQKPASDKEYHREPFAADVSEGKNDPIYNAHSYHTKVPHKAIMRYILHYTNPGDIVFDGFCGTGMTGVAAQMCGDRETVASLGYQVKADGTILQEEIDESGKTVWKSFSKLGARKAVLNDLSPAATFIAYNYNTPVDVKVFEKEAKRILAEVEKECGWMYETKHTDGRVGKINYTVWSDVFVCPECAKEVVFTEVAVDKSSEKVLETFNCPHCSTILSKKSMDRAWITTIDEATGQTIRQSKQKPVLINYSIAGQRSKFTKKLSSDDMVLIQRIEQTKIDSWYPSDRMMEGKETRRNDVIGLTHVHHFYSKRNLYILSKIREQCKNNKQALLMFNSQLINVSKLNRYRPGVSFPYNPLSGTMYVGSQISESNVFVALENKIKKLVEAFKGIYSQSLVSTMSTTEFTQIDVDYIFIDPPFGANLNYSELSSLWEYWLNARTDNKNEAIENSAQNKGLSEYRHLMLECFKKTYSLLKPGRWITVEFSNTQASVWNSIQSALTEVGFIVANVSALDKQQGSFKAVTTPTAVKQDLVISAYKPSGDFEARFTTEAATEEGVWDFIRTHLKYLPITKSQGQALLSIPERDPRILFDQLVAYYVRKGYQLPIDSKEFQMGLSQRFSERDGMFFLPEQTAEYDKKKLISGTLIQATLFVKDEASAIDWLRQLLKTKPQTFADINPQFMQQLGGWSKNEAQLDLRELLSQNFLCYDGQDEVPDQIHSYLSSNWKELRNLAKNDPALITKAKDRWYVPDPNKAGDLEKLREKSLLKEFEEYKAAKKKLKVFRIEAVRVGFKKLWEQQEFAALIAVAEKLPSNVLEEDPVLLMYYDQAVTLSQVDTDDEW